MAAEFKYIVRVANTDLDGNKPISKALTKIKGIGFSFSNMVCGFAEVEKTKKTGDLEDKEIEKLNNVLTNVHSYNTPKWMLNRRKDLETGEDKHLLSGDLTWATETDVKLMKKIKSYKGYRHAFGLPVRGQRTRSNFRRNKGKVMGVTRKAQAAQKKPAEAKK